MSDPNMSLNTIPNQLKLYNVVQEITRIRGCDYTVANKSWRNFKYENKNIQPVLNLVKLRTLTQDGKMRKVDHCDEQTLARIIVLLPSKDLDQIKQEMAIKSVRNQGKLARRGLTDVYQARGIQGMEYAMLTNEEYKGIYGLTAKQMKEAKGVGEKGNLRDHMSKGELALTMMMEVLTEECLEQSNATGYYEVKKIVQESSAALKRMREIYEKEINKSVITPAHLLNQK